MLEFDRQLHPSPERCILRIAPFLGQYNCSSDREQPSPPSPILQIVLCWNSIVSYIHRLKAFILLPVHSSDCTISGAVQLLFRPGTTLPALSDFAVPDRDMCSNGVSSFKPFDVANS